MADEAKPIIEEEEEILVAYEEDAEEEGNKKETKGANKGIKKGYVGIHTSGFRDFLLKPDLLRAVTDCGFEHPSEVQQVCIPQAVLGMDIICQAKAGMGKTAVFVLACLQQLAPENNVVDTLVLCHTRELAYQICQEFLRFSKYLPGVRVKVFFGGIPMANHVEALKEETPHIVVGTPGRVLQLIREGHLKVDNLSRFVMDECDYMLNTEKGSSMRRDVQFIFKETPHAKQVMMFSATLPKAVRPVCRKFTHESPLEIFVDDESTLKLHGLQQYYVKLEEDQKSRKLNELLDYLDFNQVVIFVNSTSRCKVLNKLLTECNFPSICIYGGLKQEERLDRYNKFKDYQARIMVSTDIFGRGVDFERINIVINYDMPPVADQYLHRVARSGRFGTKGLAISFVSSEEDSDILNQVQSRFELEIPELPNEIDVSTYMST